jgi:drug/metabolite transporter superfamily protein YnfA
MRRERALKVVLVLVGLMFTAAVYPLTMFFSREPALAMMLSLYVTLGVFLLLAARNPSAHRSLIAFTAWSSFAHAAVMGTQVYRKVIEREEMMGVAVLIIIGVVLIALAPGKQPGEGISAAGRVGGSPHRDLAGGHNDSRTSAKSSDGIAGIGLYGWDLPSDDDFVGT